MADSGDNLPKQAIKPAYARITKFAYLCELLDLKKKHDIGSIPFTVEGYNRAKSILKDRCGKALEIIKSYAKVIMNVPYIPCTTPRKIKDFSEQLNHCVTGIANDGDKLMETPR